MWDAAGLSRNGDDLTRAAARPASWRTPAVSDAKSAEDANLPSSRGPSWRARPARKESRGGHFRTDHPEPEPSKAKRLRRSGADSMLSRHQIERVVDLALEEDAPSATSRAGLHPGRGAGHRRPGRRERGVLAEPRCSDRHVPPRLRRQGHSAIADGETFQAGDVLASGSGPARSILQAERVALNLLQRMSGIATLTARYVEAVAGTKARGSTPARPHRAPCAGTSCRASAAAATTTGTRCPTP